MSYSSDNSLIRLTNSKIANENQTVLVYLTCKPPFSFSHLEGTCLFVNQLQILFSYQSDYSLKKTNIFQGPQTPLQSSSSLFLTHLDQSECLPSLTVLLHIAQMTTEDHGSRRPVKIKLLSYVIKRQLCMVSLGTPSSQPFLSFGLSSCFQCEKEIGSLQKETSR